MRLLPLILSVEAAEPQCPAPASADLSGPAAGDVTRPAAPQPDPLAGPSCLFCGWHDRRWQRGRPLTGIPGAPNAQHLSPARAAPCILCNLVLNLDRPRIDEEAILAFLPELSQAAVIALARRAHIVLAANCEPPAMDRRPKRADPQLIAAYSVNRALQARSGALEDRIGSARPGDLAAVLLDHEPGRYRRRSEILGGIRLVPLGRVFEAGIDIYPGLVAPHAEAARWS